MLLQCSVDFFDRQLTDLVFELGHKCHIATNECVRFKRLHDGSIFRTLNLLFLNEHLPSLKEHHRRLNVPFLKEHLRS